MASRPKKTAEPENKLEKQARDRLKDARRWKESGRLLDFKECYFFAAPWRQRQVTSSTQPTDAPLPDAPELNTDLAFLLVEDFTTEVCLTYLPEAQLWCERRKGMDVPQEVFDKIADKVKAQDAAIFDAIKASNFYSELPKACNPDLAIAGAGLWIHRPHAHMPIEVLAVPMREMEINLGPNGEIDDRFVVRWARNCYVETLIGATAWEKVGEDAKKNIADNPSKRSELRWGFWRLWDRIDDEVWQHVIMLGEKLVYDVELKGEGCCPLIVMRFNPTADWPWAVGPLIKGLPSLRQVDEWERQIAEAVERAVNPAITFPDDSFTQVEQGIEPGMAYAIQPGHQDAVKPIYDQPTIAPELLDKADKEHRLRKIHYIDFPEQSGDTPPTLGQWLDEMARAQRRIGITGNSFWREGPMRIFMRFKYLLEATGTIQKLNDPHGRAISTQPYNPTQRAAEQQEIATATQMAQIGAQMFPEEWKLVVNGRKTVAAFVKKMRVGGLIIMRDEGEVKMILAQISQLARSQAPDAPVPEGAGAPGPA